MNNDFNIDDFFEKENVFKPITDGLGFHHEKKVDAVKKEVNKASIAKNQALLREDLNKKSSSEMGELSAFYNNETPNTSNEELFLDVEETEIFVNESDIVIRFSAWLIDVLVLSTLLVTIISASLYLSSIPLDYFSSLVQDKTFLMLVFSYLFLIYNFYFAFFDSTAFSTVGKKMFNLRVVGINLQKVSFLRCFSRSLIVSVSFITVGLFSILKLQDKITDTMVVNE